MKRTLPFGFILLLFFLTACSGSREAAQPPAEPPRDLPQPATVNLADYEDFDAEAYPDEAPVEEVVVEHDVPEALMGGKVTASSGGSRTVQGFRIQVFLTQDKAAANAKEQQVLDWWQSLSASERPRDLFPRGPAVYVVYRQPYYRVRMGDFVERSDAQRALRLIQDQFPNASIAPDRVTVTR